jgi:hypothetical protein
MAVSGLLHWLTSQSIFLVSVEEVAQDLEKTITAEFLTCGYSPPAILAVIIIGLFMVVVLRYFGRRRFSGCMPIVGTRSACISAMCHLPEAEKEKEAAYLPVQWGVSCEIAETREQITHCSFSSLPVRQPEEGELCAGHSTAISPWGRRIGG